MEAPSNWVEIQNGLFFVIKNNDAPVGVKRTLELEFRPDLSKIKVEVYQSDKRTNAQSLP
jgi:hypothetical protein